MHTIPSVYRTQKISDRSGLQTPCHGWTVIIPSQVYKTSVPAPGDASEDHSVSRDRGEIGAKRSGLTEFSLCNLSDTLNRPSA